MSQYYAGKQWAAAMLEKAAAEQQEFDALFAGETTSAKGSRGVLVAEGDSWFDYYPLSNRDILKWLRKKHGFEVREAGPRRGNTLYSMVTDPSQLGRVYDCLEDLREDGKTPRGILLSAAGNDIADKEPLMALLNHKTSGLPPLKDPEVDQFISTHLKNLLLRWIGSVDEFCNQAFGHVIPIFVHGYAKPVPDGDAFGWDLIGAFPGPWLKPAFEALGYWDDVLEEQALQSTTVIIGEMIDRFNAMLAGVDSEISHVHHVDFRPVLSNRLPDGYKEDWANELHPEKRGFKDLARAMAERIESVL